jgi:hypothetical protein
MAFDRFVDFKFIGGKSLSRSSSILYDFIYIGKILHKICSRETDFVKLAGHSYRYLNYTASNPSMDSHDFDHRFRFANTFCRILLSADCYISENIVIFAV